MFPVVEVYGLPQHMSSVHIQYLSVYFNQYSDTFYRHCCQAHIKSHSHIIAGSETWLHHYTLTMKKNVITSMEKNDRKETIKAKYPCQLINCSLLCQLPHSLYHKAIPGAVFLKMSCPFITQARPCTLYFNIEIDLID